MICPTCGEAVPAGEQRCPSCRSVVAPQVEGALAPDHRLGTPATGERSEPIRELPGARRRERTWRDEVRDRVRDRRRQRSGDADLPLFREPSGDDEVPEDASAEPVVPSHLAVTRRMEIGGIRDEPAGEPMDLPLRPEVDDPADRLRAPVGSERARAALDAPATARHEGEAEGDVRRDQELPQEGPRLLLDERVRVEGDGGGFTLGDEGDEAPEWALEAPSRPQPAPVERPADWFERLQAGLVDLALLAALWTIVVYFASRAAHVPVAGLRPSWPYLLGYLAFLGLAYAAYFTGATGQTLGKLVSGLRVVDSAGQPPGYARAFVRAALGAAGVVLLFGGLVPMFLDPARRAFHDRLLRTRVVKG